MLQFTRHTGVGANCNKHMEQKSYKTENGLYFVYGHVLMK